jgi:hypothetical protein
MALLSTSELNTKINAIKKSASELQSEIQLAAVNAVGYSIEHGDITIGQRLFDALPSGVRRASLAAFFEKHGNFAYLKEEKRFAYYKNDERTFDEVALLGISWASAKKEVITSEYDLDDMFTKFMNRIEKAFKEHQSSGAKIKNPEIYDYLAQARDSYNSDKVMGDLKIAA